MSTSTKSTKTLFGTIIGIALPVAIFAGGIFLAKKFIANPPKARRQPPQQQTRLVEVMPVEFAAHSVRIHAMGEVRPARQINLAAQVSGSVVYLSPGLVPGASVKAGDVLMKIEDTDYRLALTQREAALEQARRDLLLEQGQNVVAAKEAEWSGLTPESAAGQLIRRKPQLRAAEAAVVSAEAAVDMAKLNLARCEVRAPFDAVVLAKHADLGSYLNSGGIVANLAGTDAAWIEASLPADELKWLTFPNENGEGGSTATLRIAGAGPREGRVIRRLSDLENQGRLARVLVEVADPLAIATDADPLLWGAYASIELQGRTLENAASISRRYIHGQNEVYVLNGGKVLEMRKVEIAYRGNDNVLVTGGLEPGAKLITTDLPVAVEGMALRLPGDAKAEGARP